MKGGHSEVWLPLDSPSPYLFLPTSTSTSFGLLPLPSCLLLGPWMLLRRLLKPSQEMVALPSSPPQPPARDQQRWGGISILPALPPPLLSCCQHSRPSPSEPHCPVVTSKVPSSPLLPVTPGSHLLSSQLAPHIPTSSWRLVQGWTSPSIHSIFLLNALRSLYWKKPSSSPIPPLMTYVLLSPPHKPIGRIASTASLVWFAPKDLFLCHPGIRVWLLLPPLQEPLLQDLPGGPPRPSSPPRPSTLKMQHIPLASPQTHQFPHCHPFIPATNGKQRNPIQYNQHVLNNHDKAQKSALPRSNCAQYTNLP